MKTFDKKGFMLVELLISLSFLAIILLLIFSLYFTNVKSFNREDVVLELQYQAQVAINYFLETAMKSEGIIEIRDINNSDYLKGNDDISIRKVIFKTGNIGNIFEVKYNKLFTGNGTSGSATTEVATYVKAINLKPLPIGKNFSNANGLEITIILEKDNITESYNTKVFFRNKR